MHTDPSILTKGRYWFCGEKTPFYPRPHNLGSRDWTSDQRDPWPALGEWAGAYQWSNGLPPRPRPLPVLVGSPKCIESGETAAEPQPEYPASTCRQYPLACYANAQPGVFDIQCCEIALRFAQVLLFAYSDIPLAHALFQNFVGLDWTVTDQPEVVDSIPTTIIGLGPNRVAIVVITGTTNFQQLALQGLYATIGLTNYGQYSTYALWEGGARTIMERLATATGGAFNEIYFVGHSLGGAVAQLLGAKMHAGRPDVRVNILTYGMPVAGDSRVNDAVDGTNFIHWKGIDDPVPGLPPQGADLVSMFDFIVGAEREKFLTLESARHRFVIDDGGVVFEDDSNTLPFSTQDALMQLIIGGMATPAFDEHLMATYYRRLGEYCPCSQVAKVFVNRIGLKFEGTQTYLGVDYVWNFEQKADWDFINKEWSESITLPGLPFQHIDWTVTPMPADQFNGPLNGVKIHWTTFIGPPILQGWSLDWVIQCMEYWTPIGETIGDLPSTIEFNGFWGPPFNYPVYGVWKDIKLTLYMVN